MQERDTLKVIKHGRKIRILVPPVEPWFNKLLLRTKLKNLALCGYGVVNRGMINMLVERLHHETSSFHLPHGEMTITVDDVACMLHIPIREHSWIMRELIKMRCWICWLSSWDLPLRVSWLRLIKLVHYYK